MDSPLEGPVRDEALVTLATRYFSSHGPATLSDFVWWSGLRVKDARLAIDAAGAGLTQELGRARVVVGAVEARAPRSSR